MILGRGIRQSCVSSERTWRNSDATVLKGGSDPKNGGLFKSGSNDLESDWQAFAAQSAGNGERRQSQDIDPASQPGGGDAGIFVASA